MVQHLQHSWCKLCNAKGQTDAEIQPVLCMHPQGHISLFLICIKGLYILAVVVSKSIPSSPFTATPRAPGATGGKAELAGKTGSTEKEPREDITWNIHYQAHTCGRVEEAYKTAVPAGGMRDRCQQGGAWEFGWGRATYCQWWQMYLLPTPGMWVVW